MHQVSLRLDPVEIPNHIDVDVTALTIGHGIHVRDLKLPPGIEVLDDVDATVCVVTAPKAVEEPAVPAAPEAAPEPELIRKPKEGEEGEAQAAGEGQAEAKK